MNGIPHTATGLTHALATSATEAVGRLTPVQQCKLIVSVIKRLTATQRADLVPDLARKYPAGPLEIMLHPEQSADLSTFLARQYPAVTLEIMRHPTMSGPPK